MYSSVIAQSRINAGRTDLKNKRAVDLHAAGITAWCHANLGAQEWTGQECSIVTYPVVIPEPEAASHADGQVMPVLLVNWGIDVSATPQSASKAIASGPKRICWV